MTLLEEREKFVSVTKLILKKDLSKNPNTLNEYRIKIIVAYNNFAKYCATAYEKGDDKAKRTVEENYYFVRGKLENCLINPKCEYYLEEKHIAELQEKDVSEIEVQEVEGSETDSDS